MGLPGSAGFVGFEPNPDMVYFGRIVVMDQVSPGNAGTVIPDGALYVSNGIIKAAQPRSEQAPAGFPTGTATMVETHGTIFPGLIELHNHPEYNVVPMAIMDRKYNNRDEWRPSPSNDWLGSPIVSDLLATPMLIANGIQDGAAAVARYVETKAIIAGTTTNQGIPIDFKHPLAPQDVPSIYYTGLVRAVENPGDVELAAGESRIDDCDSPANSNGMDALPKSAQEVATDLRLTLGCWSVHLCEGDNVVALPGAAPDLPSIPPVRSHFDCLNDPMDGWSLSDKFVGVHCLGLQAEDLQILADHGAAMVWSPLSNYILYGRTTDMQAVRNAKDPQGQPLRIGLGADWSFTGSKNLFGEMKVARAVSDYLNLGFSDREIIAMATIDAARILQWDARLGSLEPGKLADFMVLKEVGRDPYRQFISSAETSIILVAVKGKAVFGTPDLMAQCAVFGEAVTIGGQPRVVALYAATENPQVAALSLAHARTILSVLYPPGSPVTDPLGTKHGILHLGNLGGAAGTTGPIFTGTQFYAGEGGQYINYESSLRGLDPLTVADDPEYFTKLELQPNLPAGLAAAIQALYSL